MTDAISHLREFISSQGRNLGNGILKVDALINHQIQPEIMQAFGQIFAERFASQSPTRILTAEVSGIAPAVFTALELGVPVVFARKKKPVTMSGRVYMAVAESRTKGGNNELVVSAEFLHTDDRVLVIDDFLARGKTSAALLQLIREAGATPVGYGCLVEKQFEGGRQYLRDNGFADIPIEALASIVSMDDVKITLAD
ncbi:xanthine phosphoribosyltransferase [Cerasicoccus frondis]|uniref:xanthine phosphoribosyltransferase n=1 Tax=Cerasicoccus frondis TaxID=490090 RepID=UPI002852963A|nr:xanthine phosphoribosyltransferase [Cerasicoccus frondis]